VKYALSGSIDVQHFDLDSKPIDLVWCGPTRDTVFVLTELNSLYKSEDKGFSWKKLNDLFLNTGKDQLEENDNEVGKVARIKQSPVDKSLLLFLGTHGINWLAEDCGRKIKALNHGRKIKEFIFHPTERTWGLASAYTLCEDFEDDQPCRIYKELFVTQDMGENWRLLANYVVQFNWGIVNGSNVGAGIPKARILLTYEPRGKGDQTNKGWNYKIDFVYSDDFFRTKKIAAAKGNKFIISQNYIFVAQVVDQQNQEVMLLSAGTNEYQYDLKPIETNNNKFREHSYTFLETTDSSVFLHINHLGKSSKYGHIYISDDKGSKYSQSLQYNVRGVNGQCDFKKVDSLEGTYIANVYDSEYMKENEQMIEQQELANDNMDEKKDSRTENTEAYRGFITTVVTYNKGGTWQRLKSPNVDSTGAKYDCGDECNLNLHGISSDYPPFYSVDSAVGLIIANGSVGKYLSHDQNDINTYLSRDGGLTWFEIKKGPHIYEIGDHGALVTLADTLSPTNKIYFSWNEGLSFEEFKVSDSDIMIENVIIEPTSTSQHFVIYGKSTKKGQAKGVVIGLDFTALHEPQCRNPETPDSPDSDYEKWSPHDGRHGSECLMGRKTIFHRRKREAQCFNGQDFERMIITELCQCTDNDYECDVGFRRAEIGQPCTRINKHVNETEVFNAPENCKSYYSISKGYRKIPGNTCINGIKFDPVLIPCPWSFNALVGSPGKGLFILASIIVVYFLFTKGYIKSVLEIVTPKKDSYGGYKTSYADLGNNDLLDNRVFDDDEEEMNRDKNKKNSLNLVSQDDNMI